MSNKLIKVNDSIYQYFDLIGSRVKLKNVSIGSLGILSSNKNLNIYYTIKDILFRSNSLGEIIAVVELKELPNEYFTFTNIVIDHISKFINSTATCGTFLCNEAVCGHNVDKYESSPGLKLVDSNNNVIKDGYLVINGSKISNYSDNDGSSDNISIMTINTNGGSF